MTSPRPSSHLSDSFSRKRLLAELQRQGIHDARVLAALDRIPRDRFVAGSQRDFAWENVALAISHGQTISQPLAVAIMTQALALDGSERVLEIGTGSGYQAAVLAELAREVTTIERIPELAAGALERFRALRIHNILCIVGDGSDGWAAGAPYDAVMVTAGTREMPAELLQQLEPGHGRMVIPLGPSDEMRLTLVRYEGDALTQHDLGGVRFVPLIRDHIREQST